jgi:hypothetical protein
MPRFVLKRLFTELVEFYPVGKNGARFCEPIPFIKILCATLYHLGSGMPLSNVANQFGMAKSTFSMRFDTVINMIIEQLGPVFLKWPSIKRQKYIAHKFALQRNFVGVVGCVDGSHIPIRLVDEEMATDYYCRKGFFSIVLQATVDHIPIFTDIYVGWPGSVSDARVWRNSPLKRKLDEISANPNSDPLFKLSGGHLLGDGGYPLSEHMLVPFKDNGRLLHKHRRYNKRHSGTRMRVEQSFGVLKNKWRVLELLKYKSIQLDCKVVTACCILHNFVMLEGVPINDQAYDPNLQDTHNTVLNGSNTGQTKRQCIMDHLMNIHVALFL